ncbi:hypothetical protein Nizo2535_0240 [Lactiplantibacillus plantarum]|nr:hypothetical protein Nizo2535_0240 [Lactiplantibacillus plantarum]KZU79542.1 hypothetical protein Nizo2891_1293 [Lactiplantibacillus plantarum]
MGTAQTDGDQNHHPFFYDYATSNESPHRRTQKQLGVS